MLIKLIFEVFSIFNWHRFSRERRGFLIIVIKEVFDLRFFLRNYAALKIGNFFLLLYSLLGLGVSSYPKLRLLFDYVFTLLDSIMLLEKEV